jgi:hypothetical protein
LKWIHAAMNEKIFSWLEGFTSTVSDIGTCNGSFGTVPINHIHQRVKN